MPELKPCPFCGAEDPDIETEEFKGFIYTRVSCWLCNVSTDAYLFEERAIEAWNRRAE